MSPPRHSNLFLLELILCLSIFTLCAGVCTALLVHARGMSQESTRLTQSVYLAQSTAEALRTGTEIPQAPEGYHLDITVSEPTQGISSAAITVCFQEEPVYTLETAWPEVVVP